MPIDPGSQLTSRNRLAQMLMAQEQSAPPIQSHTQGLASMLRQGLAGYMQGADNRERSQAYKTMMEALRAGPTTREGAMPSGQYGPGAPEQVSGMANAYEALSGLDTEYGNILAQQAGMMDYQSREAARQAELQRQQEREDYLYQQENKAFAPQGPQGPVTVAPGASLVDPITGEPLYTAPPRQKAPETVTTSEGVFVLNADGTLGGRLGAPYSNPTSGGRPASGIQYHEELQGLRSNLNDALSSGDQAAIDAAQQALTDFENILARDPDVRTRQAAGTAAGQQAVEMSGDAVEQLGAVRTNIGNINDAIAAIDSGANTGYIYSKLPSVSEASIALDNVQRRMGLDVIGSVTFGALSEGELKLALDTAIPMNLEPQALREWLIAKRDAQTKLANYLNEAAIFLGTPGNTAADWQRRQQDQYNSQQTNDDEWEVVQ